MWYRKLDWKELRFGVEIEFIGVEFPDQVDLLPGWEMSLDERQIDETGMESGSELKPPPLHWGEREQIREMLNRLKMHGATANWSCGLHVHIGLEPWGLPMVMALLDTALAVQEALQGLLRTSEHRRIYCPPVTDEMKRRYMLWQERSALRYQGRPQSHRCGLNMASWFDIGTVEIRYANGSLEYDEIIRTVELCLRFVSAVGAGSELPDDPVRLALALGAPAEGYPPPATPPRWYMERVWLEEALIPVFAPMAERLVPEGEIHHILPVPEGILVAIENQEGKLHKYTFRPSGTGWELLT
ncbi:amidoligase family protein [Paenibacillus sp. J2TS4]|uniref:amidoligase family protein n=1 Tax=Paenibacillus sp. J2TS4 TaxID=2807194 RepID=UPI001B174038|nr:amidoligase family protein [Paenibacillus sp. J2TS4]GIP34713.1 hypothetical protein J2TS4_39230 [Paenibacillus sp. J2TS4]